jgi:hypothetical protein
MRLRHLYRGATDWVVCWAVYFCFKTSFVEWLPRLGRETLRTGGEILADIADNKSPDISARDIISKHVGETTQNLIGRLRGGGRKRKRAPSKKKKKQLKALNEPS